MIVAIMEDVRAPLFHNHHANHDYGDANHDYGDANHNCGDANRDYSGANHDCGDANHNCGDANRDYNDANHDYGDSNHNYGDANCDCSGANHDYDDADRDYGDTDRDCHDRFIPGHGCEERRKCLSSNPVNESSQVAIIGVKFSQIESLDYEIVENDVLKQDWRSRSRPQILQYIALKWTLAFLVGIITAAVAFSINLSVENISGVKFSVTTAYLKQNRIGLAFAVFGGVNLVLVLFSASICAFISPEAAGSGIPEVKAYLNGVDAPNILAPKTLLVKIFGNIATVASSLVVGKEGPLVHIGACIASLLSQAGSRRYHLTWNWLRYFKNDRDRRDLVSCGAAAGVAAAFRSPVGGVLFALEEVTSWWRSALLWRSFFTVAVVAVVLRMAIDFCKTGRCGSYGTGGLIMYDISDISSVFGLAELIPVVILGVIGGLLGSLFNFVNGKIVKVYSFWNSRHGPAGKLLQAAVISIATSICIFGIPWMGKCLPCLEANNQCPNKGLSGNFKQFTCEENHYNDLASLFLNTNDDVIRNLFSVNTPNEFRYTSLLIFIVARFALALVTYGIAIPAGLFIPVILVGASYGRLTGMVMRYVGFQKLDEGLYSVLGAASLLGGSMRMTVSICVILLELTNNLLLLPLTMIVLLISKTIGDMFNENVYDQILRIKGLPLLHSHPEPFMMQLTASDVCSVHLVSFSAIEKVRTIVDVLQRTNHNGFPVVDGCDLESTESVLYGLILRSHLLVLLRRKQFLPSRVAANWGDRTRLFTSFDFAKPGSGKGAKIQDLQLSAKEEEMFVDLRPFINSSPYTVIETMSLAKAFSLFRQIGLRHLLVVPKSVSRHPVVGMLTRHDFMLDYIFSLHPHLQKSSKGN